MDVGGHSTSSIQPANLDDERRPWTFWKHSQGAGIETRATHQKNWPLVLVDPNGRDGDDLDRKFIGIEDSSSTRNPARFTLPVPRSTWEEPVVSRTTLQ